MWNAQDAVRMQNVSGDSTAQGAHCPSLSAPSVSMAVYLQRLRASTREVVVRVVGDVVVDPHEEGVRGRHVHALPQHGDLVPVGFQPVLCSIARYSNVHEHAARIATPRTPWV